MSVQTKVVSVAVAETSSDDIVVPAVTDPRLIGLVAVTGTVTYTVEFTLDGVTYHPLSDEVTGVSENEDFTVVFPVRSIRVTLGAGSTGSVQMIVRSDFGGF